MKYVTQQGVEVDVKPIGLTERDKFLAVRAVQECFADEPTWDERLDMHEKFVALCEMCKISGAAVCEGDIVPIISILINGETPKN